MVFQATNRIVSKKVLQTSKDPSTIIPSFLKRRLHSKSNLLDDTIHIKKPPPPVSPLFHRVLIANRGEIARRIIRTCHLHNIETVALYTSLGDSIKSPHVREATHSICLGSNPKSFLDIDRICEAIVTSDSDAVHPGYGFLSENADFSDRVSQIPLTQQQQHHQGHETDYCSSSSSCRTHVSFLGPTGNAIRLMGDKLTSKQMAREAGVNIVPGYHESLYSHQLDKALHIANHEISYPVMIKALAGGGGKGMRICRNDDELKEGWVLSTAEAKQFFKDERVFLEQYIERPHHIEFQVLAGRRPSHCQSNSGNEDTLDILCFPERECSIQRRNQKIIEESPSCLLHPSTRAEMVRQVKSLIRRVGYTSAGTVEFLVDEDQHFYFLEMNTRLQVEHPVTEILVSSGEWIPNTHQTLNQVDLVKGMIDVAAGRGVPREWLDKVEQSAPISSHGVKDIEGTVMPFKGHAIEARVYAEDPFRDFLPSTGNVLQYVEPPIGRLQNSQESIRVDSGIVEGCAISPFFDPMISKLVAYSPDDRQCALDALETAVDQYVVRGVNHNLPFISELLRHPDFKEGKTPTNFIPKHYPSGFHGVELTHNELCELAAVAACIHAQWECTPTSEEVVVCLDGMFGHFYGVSYTTFDKTLIHVRPLSYDGACEDVSLARNIYIQRMHLDSSSLLATIVCQGLSKTLQIQRADVTGTFKMKMFGAEYTFLVMKPLEFKLSRFMKRPKLADTRDYLLSPMPGTLIRYAVKEGDHVHGGQEICVVEAMKMQNVLKSSRKGIIKSCRAKVGSSLKTDEIVIEYEKSIDIHKK